MSISSISNESKHDAAASFTTYDRAFMDLAHVLAHRLRGLVASIEGFTDLLTDTLSTYEQRELALRIFEGAARIERILADLKLYGAPVEPVPALLHADDVADDLLAVLEEVDLERTVVDVQDAAGRTLRADPVLLRQALLILTQNAFEATHTGTVYLRVYSAAEAEQLCFDVCNGGVIDVDAAAEQVFMPFFTTKAQNLGVGLTIARRIAEAHGGTLMLAENGPATGIRFSLRLPAATVPDVPAPATFLHS